MATPRETLKYYFRKHALPTEQQFAELIDAFVHVDEDTITQEKIDGLINALAGKVSSETFESFKTEIQETVTNNGGDLSALTARVTTAEGNITTLRDDVDTNADNISGLNQRVEALEERPQITVDSTLDGESTNPVENKAVTEALGSKADSADVTALSERVSTLETAEPPQVTGSYLKQIADLDSYEGTDGEIVQYIGATNDKYRRGFCFEKKAGEGTGETISSVDESFTITQDNVQYEAGQELDLTGEYRRLRNVVGRLFNTNYSRWINKTPIEAGDEVYDREYGVHHIVTEDEVSDINDNETHTNESYPYVYERVSDGLRLGLWPHEYPGYYSNSEIYVLGNDNTTINSVYRPKGSITIVRGEEFTVEIGTPASWQVIPTSPCVN